MIKRRAALLAVATVLMGVFASGGGSPAPAAALTFDDVTASSAATVTVANTTGNADGLLLISLARISGVAAAADGPVYRLAEVDQVSTAVLTEALAAAGATAPAGEEPWDVLPGLDDAMLRVLASAVADRVGDLPSTNVRHVATVSGTTVVTGVTPGIYVVVDRMGDSVPFVVSTSASRAGNAAWTFAAVAELKSPPQAVLSKTHVTVPADAAATDGDELTIAATDEVRYTVTGTVPASSDQPGFSYVITDIPPAGFELAGDDGAGAVTISVGGVGLPAGAASAALSVVAGTTRDRAIESLSWDLSSILTGQPAGTQVRVEYSLRAAASGTAVTQGNQGNTNTATVRYLDFATSGASPRLVEYQATAQDAVYTTAVTLAKVSEDGRALSGAAFTVTRVAAGTSTVIAGNAAASQGASANLLTVRGLEAGTYLIEESEVPAGRTAADPVMLIVSFDGSTTAFSFTATGEAARAVDVVDGTATITIVNTAAAAGGGQLPWTGAAIGAVLTIGVLLIGAGILLARATKGGPLQRMAGR